MWYSILFFKKKRVNRYNGLAMKGICNSDLSLKRQVIQRVEQFGCSRVLFGFEGVKRNRRIPKLKFLTVGFIASVSVKP